MAMRPNSRNWPVWVVLLATAWFVAITFAWAASPLTDHVPLTVEHVVKAGDTAAPGARDPGPTIDVTCGTPAGGSAFAAKGLPDLAVLRDGKGKPFNDPQFARTPCTSFHSQSHGLWFANVALYVVALGVIAWVLRQRMRSSRHATMSAQSPVGV